MTIVPTGAEWATNPAHRHVMRSLLILRDGPWCHYCRCTFSSRGRRCSFDHLWPQSLGRIDLEWNLVLACRDCNSRRGSRLDFCSCERCASAIARASRIGLAVA